MTLFDDGVGVLLELLRPKSEVSRVEAAEPRPLEDALQTLGSGAILRVIEPSMWTLAEGEALRAVRLLIAALERSPDVASLEPWREHLAAVATRAFPLADVLATSHTALLTPRAGSSGDASLAWFTAAGALPSQLCMAALIPTRARRRRSGLDIESDLRCDVCGKLQHAAGDAMQWLGAPAQAELSIAPICLSCLGATAARDPRLWARSALRLLAGERTAPPPASRDRGRLRVVRDR